MAVTSSSPGRAYSIGTVKNQRATITAQSGDTTATIMFTSLSRVNSVAVGGLVLTAIVYPQNNTCQITFIDPGKDVVATAEAHGY